MPCKRGSRRRRRFLIFLVDSLFLHSESWMKLDVVQLQAIHYSHLAHAGVVHIHPGQLSAEVVIAIRNQGIHAWDVNDEQSLEIIAKFGIPRICTDHFKLALAFRDKMS